MKTYAVVVRMLLCCVFVAQFVPKKHKKHFSEATNQKRTLQSIEAQEGLLSSFLPVVPKAIPKTQIPKTDLGRSLLLSVA